jgi:hypothetical protein
VRGLASIFFGRDLTPDEVSTVLVVCSADWQCFPEILSAAQKQFPGARFSYVVLEEWAQIIPEGSERFLVSDLKKRPLQILRDIRSRKFDATVLMLTGHPVFRNVKLWALLTNYRVLVVYNETNDRNALASTRHGEILRYLVWRFRKDILPSLKAWSLAVLLFLPSLIYLLFYTGSVFLRMKMRRTHEGA